MNDGPAPCPECKAIERKVLIGAMLAGALMGAGVVLIFATRMSK